MNLLLRSLLLLLGLFGTLSQAANPWQLSLPGWKYQFPRDHGSHPGFKTEWWYFTGHLESADGQRFGYQLTFFRQGVRPPSATPAGTSRFLMNDVPFGHFAFTQVGNATLHLLPAALARSLWGGRIRHTERRMAADGSPGWKTGR